MTLAVSALHKHPELIPILRRCIDRQKKYVREMHRALIGIEGWDRFQVGAEAAQLSKLMGAGFLECTHHTASQTLYRVIDMDRVGELLGALEQERAEVAEVLDITQVDETVFDWIVGYDDVKRLMVMALRAARPVHFLLVGPPASGKSLFMYALERLGAQYLTGDGLSGPGLIDMMFTNPVPLLAVDELDKAKREALYPLLHLMEEGILSETKYGRTRAKKVPVKVFAAANRVSRMLEEQLSRFQVLYFKPYTKEEYHEVVKGVLVKVEGVDPDMAEEIARMAVIELDSMNVREAVRIARLARTNEDVEFVVRTFKEHSA